MSPLPAPEPHPERFEGHDGRECGEHRTTGPRAWCSNCQEWCYPGILCRGCELPLLRQRAEQAEAALQRVRQAANDAMDCQRSLDPSERARCAMCGGDHLAHIAAALDQPEETR